MKERILEMLNEQIQMEFDSAYAYLGIASYFDSLGLCGFSHWYKKQAQEEESHAMRIYDFIYQCGQSVTLFPVGMKEQKIKGIEHALNIAMNQEQDVSKSIFNIYYAASDESDLTTCVFLEWFVTEQQEEEDSARNMMERFKMIGNSSDGLFFMDKELKKR